MSNTHAYSYIGFLLLLLLLSAMPLTSCSQSEASSKAQASTPQGDEALAQLNNWQSLGTKLFKQTGGGRGADDLPVPLNENQLTDFEADLAKFALVSKRLGAEIDARDKEDIADLGCILRGMAEEAKIQMRDYHSAETDIDKSVALNRLSYMFDDAATFHHDIEKALAQPRLKPLNHKDECAAVPIPDVISLD